MTRTFKQLRRVNLEIGPGDLHSPLYALRRRINSWSWTHRHEFLFHKPFDSNMNDKPHFSFIAGVNYLYLSLSVGVTGGSRWGRSISFSFLRAEDGLPNISLECFNTPWPFRFLKLEYEPSMDRIMARAEAKMLRRKIRRSIRRIQNWQGS